MNPKAWRGMKYPDSEVVALVHRFARPGRDVVGDSPRAIDVGCGGGRHVRFLNEVGYHAYGIDSDPEMCACARDNGIEVLLADVQSYRPSEPPALALCWGLMMLVPDAPQIVARWRAEVVIADWRTPTSSCFQWPGNEALSSPAGFVRLRNPGHVLDGLIYRAYPRDECVIPGYDRIYWQQVSKVNEGERNEWYQTVHRRR